MRTCVRVGSRAANILHADLDAFYASVEQRDDPRLRGRPVIVGAGVVLGLQLRGQGVRRAHRDERWTRRCAAARRDRGRPADVGVLGGQQGGVQGVRGHHAAGRRALDRRGVPGRWRAAKIRGTPLEIAQRLRAEVLSKVGLPITVGVARTKFLAKVAKVAKPNGLLEVAPDRSWSSCTRWMSSGCGVRRGDRGEAAESRAHQGRRCRDAARGRAGRDARSRVRSASARAGAQPRSAADRGRAAPAVDRFAAGARPIAQVAGHARRRAGRPGRPGDPADADGGAVRADRHAAPALRRLQPGDPVPHVASGNGSRRGRS